MTLLSLLLTTPPHCHLVPGVLPEFGGGGGMMKFSEILLHPLLKDDCGEIWMRVSWSWPELPSPLQF